MKLLHHLSALLFPPKCVLCRRVLEDEETDLCRSCRTHTLDMPLTTVKLPYLTQWTALWYYEGDVRQSLLRLKFGNARHIARTYGRLLAMRLTRDTVPFDILTWVPISARRKWKRGYDQVELLARAVGDELGIQPVKTLKKRRHTPPQSGIQGSARRRANVLGAYETVVPPETLAGKRVLLLDDVITTGATAGECARVLLTAGAKEVRCAAVAAANHQQKNQ